MRQDNTQVESSEAYRLGDELSLQTNKRSEDAQQRETPSSVVLEHAPVQGTWRPVCKQWTS
jgi:hypothetical protein